jgi:hypothetical protein
LCRFADGGEDKEEAPQDRAGQDRLAQSHEGRLQQVMRFSDAARYVCKMQLASLLVCSVQFDLISLQVFLVRNLYVNLRNRVFKCSFTKLAS